MVLNKIKTILIFIILIFLLTACIGPIISGNVNYLKNKVSSTLNISHLSTNTASLGDSVIIYGTGFGTVEGYVILSGLKIYADSWSDTEIVMFVIQV